MAGVSKGEQGCMIGLYLLAPLGHLVALLLLQSGLHSGLLLAGRFAV